jgi:glycosyltransferase involved in cell wall biosynthesis
MHVVFAGRLEPVKGGLVLLEALRRLPDVQATFAGAGPHRSELEQTAASTGLSGRVAFVGSVSSSRVLELMREAHAVIFPSLWPEPAGNVLIEAMAVGRATVCATVGGAPEFVEPGRTGLLVPPGDPEALARAIEALARDRERLERMGRRAWERAADYLPGPHLDRILALCS